MQFGIQINNYLASWESILSTIKTVESGPWSSLWVSDHFFPPIGDNVEHKEALEGWSLITAAATVTKRLPLGVLVSGNTYRNPALVAKMAATVDQISGGRFILGIGAGWFKREHEAFGWDFPGAKERSDRLEEAVELIKMLFTADGPINYNGQYYMLKNAYFSPSCMQKPHVPILIGGNGEKRTLRTLARFGDICNIDFNAPGSPEIFRRKIEILERYCEELGRDPNEIKKTLHMPIHLENDEKKALRYRKIHGEWTLTGSASFIINRIQEYMDVGVEEFMFGSVPSKAELYDRLNNEVLSAFM
jgi:F420-dependent oxidoreductase-like protein